MSNFYFFAYAALGKGLSGGDRIFIEFARRWCVENKVRIYLWKEGYEICKRQNLTSSKVQFKVAKMEPWGKLGFVVNYFARIIQGIITGFELRLEDDPKTILYSASEFWMDCLPVFILKKRFPKVKWVAAWYQTAPNPLLGFSTKERKKRYRFNALLYWLVQLPMKRLISRYADFVVVNNEDERKQFKTLYEKNRVIVCFGAVDLESISSFKKRQQKRSNLAKIYDGVFQGRFHPQKGVLELIDIWKIVVNKKPDASLAMIGDGPLMRDVKSKIEDEKLRANVKLFGFVFDGEKKFKIFSQSKIVVHPSFYDSGGMAAAEAMAFGLPAVGFDLPSYNSYYPKGMVKVETGKLDKFALAIEHLLNDGNYYQRLSKEALDTIGKNWSWDGRAEEILTKISDA